MGLGGWLLEINLGFGFHSLFLYPFGLTFPFVISNPLHTTSSISSEIPAQLAPPQSCCHCSQALQGSTHLIVIAAVQEGDCGLSPKAAGHYVGIGRGDEGWEGGGGGESVKSKPSVYRAL